MYDPCLLLGCARDATPAELRASALTWACVFHPWKGGNPETMRVFWAAFQWLLRGVDAPFDAFLAADPDDLYAPASWDDTILAIHGYRRCDFDAAYERFNAGCDAGFDACQKEWAYHKTARVLERAAADGVGVDMSRALLGVLNALNALDALG